MLDYKKLKKEIDSFIRSMDKNFIDEWIKSKKQNE